MNSWNNKIYESDEDNYNTDEDKYTQNEAEPPTLSEEFINNILTTKHSLYENIVLSPELGTKNAQNLNILQNYLDKISRIYIMSLEAQKGSQYTINDKSLDAFPIKSREAIRMTLDFIRDFFSKNQIPDTIPYSDFIRKSFHDYQFIQNKNFE